MQRYVAWSLSSSFLLWLPDLSFFSFPLVLNPLRALPLSLSFSFSLSLSLSLLLSPQGDFALKLAHKMKVTDWDAAGLPHAMSVRVGVHAGPAIALTDPLTGRPNLIGPHISHAARIEPITPQGEVCVDAVLSDIVLIVATRINSCFSSRAALCNPSFLPFSLPPLSIQFIHFHSRYGSFQFAALVLLENSLDDASEGLVCGMSPRAASPLRSTAMASAARVECRYVGVTPFAKGYGAFSLYHITACSDALASSNVTLAGSVTETKRVLRVAKKEAFTKAGTAHVLPSK